MEGLKAKIHDIFEEIQVRKSVIVLHDPSDGAALCKDLYHNGYPVDLEPCLDIETDERVLARFLQHRSRMLVTSEKAYECLMPRLTREANVVFMA